MISGKEAVVIAKQIATDMLGPGAYSLEEIERDTYQNRDAWSITLGVPRTPTANALSAVFARPNDLDYKRFFIDVETGEMIAMKIREIAA